MAETMAPLLRFVYATYAMRRGWEGHSREPPSIKTETCATAFPASPLGVDDAVDGWVRMLETSLTAPTEASAVHIIAQACEAARDAGSLADLVGAMATTLLDVDDMTSDERQHGLTEVMLRMCFERSSTRGTEIVATPYCDEVLAHLTDAMSELRDLVGVDDVLAHAGGRLLDRTISLIRDTLQSFREDNDTVCE